MLQEISCESAAPVKGSDQVCFWFQGASRKVLGSNPKVHRLLFASLFPCDLGFSV